MTKKVFSAIGFFLVSAALAGCQYSTSGEMGENFTATDIVVNLDTPWGIDFLPDGRMIFTERRGLVKIWDSVNVAVAGEIEVAEISEAGLLGIAVHPDFTDTRWVYLYYTYEGDEGSPINRVSRFGLKEGRLGDEKVILDGIPGERFHNGGRLKFGPDGLLYITTGDATIPSTARDIGSLAGKILRMEDDGSVPEDNPYGNYVYSYGHRNPQGLAWAEGRMYSSEHGPRRHDEINLIEKGGNYGWPQVCGEQVLGTMEPVRCYEDFTLAPGAIAYHNGYLYVTGLRGTQLRRINAWGEGNVMNEEVVLSGIGRIREAVSHGGHMYISTSNRDGRGLAIDDDDRIIRLEVR